MSKKPTLDWNEAEGKSIAVRSSVRLEIVLFVRLIQPLGGGTGFPVPYRAVKISSNYLSEHITVKVEQLQPHEWRSAKPPILCSFPTRKYA